MKFVSTRKILNDDGIDFEKVVVDSYAPDGGLYMPHEFPEFSLEEVRRIAALPYPQIVASILRKFVSEAEIPDEVIKDAAEKSFTRFELSSICRVVDVGKDGLKIGEFFHGPSWTFKDMSTFMCAQIIDHILKKQKQKAVVLIATSGDTGNSVIEAFSSIDTVDVIVIYPKYGCTEIQQRKTNTIIKSNIHCYAAEGSSDVIDIHCKKIFVDKKFAEKYSIISLNSINMLRIILQSCLSFYLYGQLIAKESSEAMQLILPCGGSGHLSSAVLAWKMGVPLRIIATTTINDIVHRALTSGDLTMAKEVIKTWSPAMDIQVPLNLERVLYTIMDRDPRVGLLMTQFMETGEAKLPEDMLLKAKSLISTFVVTDEMKLATMKRCHDEYGYLVCPHTSTAVCYFYHLLDNRKLMKDKTYVCFATADAKRFPESVKAAGIDYQTSPDVQELFKLPTKFEELVSGQNWEDIIRRKIVSLR